MTGRATKRKRNRTSNKGNSNHPNRRSGLSERVSTRACEPVRLAYAAYLVHAAARRVESRNETKA